MTYPILTTSEANAVAQKLTSHDGASGFYENDFLSLNDFIKERRGGSWQQKAFLAAAKNFFLEVSEDRKDAKYNIARLEEHFAQHIVSQLDLVDDVAVHDPDFWRYLTLFPYRQYVQLRYKNFGSERYGGGGNVRLQRWALIQALLWGLRTVYAGDPKFTSKHRLDRMKAKLSESSTDFYIENIVSRHWASYGAAARAFIEVTSSDEPFALFDTGNVSVKRPTYRFGGLVGRSSENVYFHALDQQGLTDLFQGIKTDAFSVSK